MINDAPLRCGSTMHLHSYLMSHTCDHYEQTLVIFLSKYKIVFPENVCKIWTILFRHNYVNIFKMFLLASTVSENETYTLENVYVSVRSVDNRSIWKSVIYNCVSSHENWTSNGGVRSRRYFTTWRASQMSFRGSLLWLIRHNYISPHPVMQRRRVISIQTKMQIHCHEIYLNEFTTPQTSFWELKV